MPFSETEGTLLVRVLLRYLAVGTVLGFAACTDPSFDAPTTTAAEPEADRVLTYAFDVIKDRYLRETDVGDVALAGARGLSSIDPSIALQCDPPGVIQLRYGDQAIADYPTPAGNDAAGWARLILAVDHDAASRSPEVRAADVERVHQAVLDAALAELDPFSRYAGPAEAAEHRAARNGYGGIGVHYKPSAEGVVLTDVMSDTPASDARLEVGDLISAIDSTAIAGMSSNDVRNLFRGPVGSPISLTVSHGQPQHASIVSLHRKLIVPTTATLEVTDGVAVIRITGFNQHTAASVAKDIETAKATPEFLGIIMDLRGNPGGLLDQGVAVAALFMDHGRIVSTRGRVPASVQVYSARPGGPGDDVRLVVLIDGRTASAAEIVAAALQDSGRAVVVGTNSFGKGTVQTVIQMPNDGEMTLTWSRFHAPSGYALHGLGVLPTICTADGHNEPVALLDRSLDASSIYASNVAAWRTVGVNQTDRRKELRRVCPAAQHAGLAIDPEVGRQLIADRKLYVRALALGTSPAEEPLPIAEVRP
jgi:carboxyl-terminal processing protease